MHASFLDYDLDGDLDVFVVNRPPNLGLLAEHTTKKLDTTYSCRLYENRNLRFIETTARAGVTTKSYALSVSTSDFNNDGWPDIYVCSDYVTPDILFINQRDGTFKNTILESTGHISYFSMGADAADIDNDGWQDLMVVDMVAEDNHRLKANMGGMNPDEFWKIVKRGHHYQYMFNMLQWNRGVNSKGNVIFSEIGQLAGVSATDWSWAPLFADFDNDGLKDLFITNGLRRDFRNKDATNKMAAYINNRLPAHLINNPDGKNVWNALDFDMMLSFYPEQKLVNYAYKNLGNLQFEKKSEAWGLDQQSFSNGAAYGDLDQDGDLDLVINNVNEPAFIYENLAVGQNKNHFLGIKFRKNGKPFSAFGTKVTIGYREKGHRKKQHFELINARGYESSSESRAHFGLGSAKNIDELLVVWPNGTSEKLTGVKGDRTITLDIKNASEKSETSKTSNVIFEPLEENFGIGYKHHESYYNDYLDESLLPHKMSTLGPVMAKGDVNGDKREDFFVGGSAGRPGYFFIQKANGKFIKITMDLDVEYEDGGCALFDADKDGDLDLYVTSGSNEFDNEYLYLDRLYLNDGQGIFSRSLMAIPTFFESTGVVKAFDYDKDGDLDLFVGGRQVPGRYPSPANSYILRNDLENGRVSFTDVTDGIAPELRRLGMVTDVDWSDVDNDRDADLVITGEWMPLTVFINSGGRFTNQTSQLGLANTSGWWFSLAPGDFDSDGDTDYVFGNLGLNYKYKATQNAPFEVFLNDFDESGTEDIVLSYYNFGKRYPVRGRQCSAGQMPRLKEKFPDYTSFSNASLIDAYGSRHLDNSIHYEAKMFQSVYAENLGAGKFALQELPVEAQVSAIREIMPGDFNNDGFLDMLIAGGLYDAEVETARSDAGVGLYLKGNGKGDFYAVKPERSGLYLTGDIKEMALIRINTDEVIISLPNDDSIQMHRLTKTSM